MASVSSMSYRFDSGLLACDTGFGGMTSDYARVGMGIGN